MNDNQELHDNWFRISRFRPTEEDFETLLRLLKHPRWEVRWNATRELYLRADTRALNVLTDLLQNDPVESVRNMASRALGALHEKGVTVPVFSNLKDSSPEAKTEIAIARLKELGVEVSIENDLYRLMIPHNLQSPLYIEIGYLLAQLNDIPFPESYSPITELVPSRVLPIRSNPTVKFHESYDHGMKFYLLRQQK